ncbi:hypothetical protein Tco_0602605, partial [Tanacetum coccineum]
SDGTLDDVRTVLNDRLKGIRMEYLPEAKDKEDNEEFGEICRWTTLRG